MDNFNIYSRISTSFNYGKNPINSHEVEFLIIHYSGGTWERIKEIFENSHLFNDVCAHFVIDENGLVDEVIPTIGGGTYQGSHCGESYWIDESGTFWSGFNKFSIGIELINPNGNLLKYSNKQFQSLKFLVRSLKEKYPKIKDPNRVLGHENIAGFRGKVDPGIYFGWTIFFNDLYGTDIKRENKIPLFIHEIFINLYPNHFFANVKNKQFWHLINYSMEKATVLYYNGVSEVKIKEWLLGFLNNIDI